MRTVEKAGVAAEGRSIGDRCRTGERKTGRGDSPSNVGNPVCSGARPQESRVKTPRIYGETVDHIASGDFYQVCNVSAAEATRVLVE